MLVQNKTSVTLSDIRVAIQYNDASGRTQRAERTFSGGLEAGKIASLDTGLGPYGGSGCPVQVIGAKPPE